MKVILSLRRHHHVARVSILLTMVALIAGMVGCGQPEYTYMVAAGEVHTVGLKSDGTVVAVGFNNNGECDVGSWTKVTHIAAGGNTLGVRSDGRVVAVGSNYYGQCEVSGWTDIVQVAAGRDHTVGVKSDGTVVAVGWNEWRQCNVSGWDLN